MASVTDVTADTFTQEVLKSSGLVVVEFFSPTCQFCKRFEPVIELLADKYEESVRFCRVNAADNRELAVEHNVFGVPTTIIFRGGEALGRFSGLVTEAEVAAKIDSVLR